MSEDRKFEEEICPEIGLDSQGYVCAECKNPICYGLYYVLYFRLKNNWKEKCMRKNSNILYWNENHMKGQHEARQH